MDNPRADKVAVVDEVRDRFAASDAAVLTEYRGLTVAELAELLDGPLDGPELARATELLAPGHRQALTIAPERVAVFGYAHVPWMQRHQALIPEAALPRWGCHR